ncbi:MAG: hypothetical protein FWC09_11555, partial [Lachnospiraceae bacterium]|nr:hypothetical protein [Lachnospiraceae bacterium]
LIMAGVKPYQYLTGLGGFILLLGTFASFAFALIGGFKGVEFSRFFLIMVLATCASIILGASIGILAKNQQAATAISVPVAVILGFSPMIAAFNEKIEKMTSFMYTLQLNTIVNDFSGNFAKAISVIAANIVVLIILFSVVYRKTGLRG